MLVLLPFGLCLISYSLQELEDVEEHLKTEQEDAQASQDARQSKIYGETVFQPDGNGKDGADTEAMKSVTLELESKKNDLVSFHFTFIWLMGIEFSNPGCISNGSVSYIFLLEFNGRKSSGFREELGSYTGKSTEAAFSRFLLSSNLLWC